MSAGFNDDGVRELLGQRPKTSNENDCWKVAPLTPSFGQYGGIGKNKECRNKTEDDMMEKKTEKNQTTETETGDKALAKAEREALLQRDMKEFWRGAFMPMFTLFVGIMVGMAAITNYIVSANVEGIKDSMSEKFNSQKDLTEKNFKHQQELLDNKFKQVDKDLEAQRVILKDIQDNMKIK
jgi:hypothetical protein